MEPLYAKYPFLAAARAAVEKAAVDLSTVVTEEPRIVDRAVGRVQSAIDEGTVGPQHRSPRVELLSYPVARVIVSLVADPGLVRRYAHAEAQTAHERIRADIQSNQNNDLESVDAPRITLDDLLEEFDLSSAVVPKNGPFRIRIGEYLRLAAQQQEDRWRLINRTLTDGFVAITRDELFVLLRDAVSERVREGLPLNVPDAVANTLSDSVAAIQADLMEHVPTREFDEVNPALFPPCIKALLDRVTGSERLPPHSQFTLVSFLSTVGMDSPEIVERTRGGGEGTERIEYQIAHLREADEPSTYPPVSCPAMVAYGDCVNKDALCERIAHPLEYYERRLAGDAPADYVSRDDNQ